MPVGLTAFRDHALDDRVEARARPLEAAGRGKRQSLEHASEGQEEPLEAGHRLVERAADLLGIPFDVGVEQRPPDDRQRQPGHLRRDIDLLPVLPAVGGELRPGNHLVPVASDPILMEERLDQTPLPEMEVALAGQEPLAEKALRFLQRAALHEAPRLGDEHFPHELGLADEIEALRADPRARDVAVGGELGQEPEWIAPHRAEQRKRSPRRPGWERTF